MSKELTLQQKMEKVKSSKFPELSNEVKKLKETEGGVRAVCEVMQMYEKLAVDEAMRAERMGKIQNLIREGATKEFILRVGYTEEEYTEAKSTLLQTV